MRRMASTRKKSSSSGISTRGSKSSPRLRLRFAVCLDNSAYPASLELHKIYRVFGDADAHRNLRIVDDSGEDYLYPAEWFAVVELPRRVRTSLMLQAARLQSV